jgi:hypothetical protein
LVVVPSWAVTTVVIVLLPTLSAIAPEALPLVVATPLTVTLALPLVSVGVTVSEVVALPTLAVYPVVADAKTGASVPLESDSADRSAFEDGARVTVTVYVLVVVPSWAVTTVVMVLAPTLSAIAPEALPLAT